MNTHDYIINDVKPFSLKTKVGEAEDAFNKLTYTHIPVLKDDVYLGCISETDTGCLENNQTLGELQYALEPFFVNDRTNWLDILEACALHNANIMPVLGEDNQYLGYFELSDIMNIFNETPFLNEAGGIIVIEKGIKDYSFSEVCQIIESNDAKILGLFISNIENDVVQLTIKIGHLGMNAIVQTFRRYNYNVVSSHDEDKLLEDLRERSNYLTKYLSM